MALVELYQKYTSLGRFVVAASLLLFAACGSLDNADLSGNADSKELRDSKRISEIYFTDETLKNCVLAQGKEYVFELQTLTCGGGITNLTGLEHFTGLAYLDLSSNNISDLSPLETLTNISSLFLSHNSQIKDISALSNMSQLTVLDSNYTSIEDISPIDIAENMSYLGLIDNKISDLSPITGLQKIYGINLEGNGLTDISYLNNLSNVVLLYIDDNDFTTIPVLDSLTSIEFISMSNNHIDELCNLSTLETLKGINLKNCDISADVSCLATLPAISDGKDLKIDFDGSTLADCSDINDIVSAMGESKVVRPNNCPL